MFGTSVPIDVYDCEKEDTRIISFISPKTLLPNIDPGNSDLCMYGATYLLNNKECSASALG